MQRPATLPRWLTATPVAHRGLHDIAAGIPENSRAAFGAALAAGYAIELDVRLSADGVAVVFHDATLERLCGRPGRVADLSAAELGRLALLGTAETPPTFAEVLALVDGRTPLLVEVKNYGREPIGALEQAVASALARYRGPFAVQSFNPRTVAWFRRHMPQFVRGQIADLKLPPGPFPRLRLAILKRLLARRHGAPHFLAYDVNQLPAPLTERARAEGLPVLAWTVRDEAQRQRAAHHADNIIFELPVRPR